MPASHPKRDLQRAVQQHPRDIVRPYSQDALPVINLLSARMDRLPPEILAMVVDVCNVDDCKNLRTTCKSFVGATTPRIFETSSMVFLYSKLQRLVQVSMHPEISKCVKHFLRQCHDSVRAEYQHLGASYRLPYTHQQHYDGCRTVWYQ